MIEVTDIKGIGDTKAETLAEHGFESVEEIAQADPDDLSEVKGVGDDRALEYMVAAGDLLDAEAEDEEEAEGDEFDLTPAEITDETDDDEIEIEKVDEEEVVNEVEVEEDAVYDVTLSFDSRLQYDVYHAALMRHHEDVYTSYQPASEAMQKLLDGLGGFDSVSYELTEFELNTLHTSVKQYRTEYQGANMIDHMDALKEVESQVDNARQKHVR